MLILFHSLCLFSFIFTQLLSVAMRVRTRTCFSGSRFKSHSLLATPKLPTYLQVAVYQSHINLALGDSGTFSPIQALGRSHCLLKIVQTLTFLALINATGLQGREIKIDGTILVPKLFPSFSKPSCTVYFPNELPFYFFLTEICINWCDRTPVWATSSLGLVEAKGE